MPSYSAYTSPSPPHNRRDHSPVKSSPLRHTLSTRSNESDTDHSSIPSRQGTISSNASSGYSNGSYSGYESTNDPPIVTRRPVAGTKRERSESPVKKNAAFAAWEQREQAAEQNQPPAQPSHKRAQTMDVSPRKIKDDEWRSGIGRSESRAALRPVASNVQPDVVPVMSPTPTFPIPTSPSRKENEDGLRYRPPNTNGMEPPPKPTQHARGRSTDGLIPTEYDRTRSTSPVMSASKNSLATLTRSDSMRASTRPRRDGHVRFSSTTEIAAPHLDGQDLAQLEKSSTPQFRHLSQMASEEGSEDFGIHSKDEQVVGLAGRRKLQRSGSVKPKSKNQPTFSSQYASTRWMDTQRKHLQAYEYLCHIGEARGWLQDVLEPIELPPIVQLEEALRDGVTLAEVVVRLATSLPPEQQGELGSLRIFRSPRLQFRHSDNVAMFFRFLAQIELPELFRFELVDLYEKKNIPKVIYCIHALSWLLYRKGIVEFRIGNLVGQLQFEEHELEETQKNIDRSGVQMPNFGGMKEAMQIEEPEPEPEPTPEELLAEQEDVIVDLQSQIRGALMRLRLGDMMQDLWAAEESIAYLQGIARGGFAREIFDFKYNMDLSTRIFQAAASGFLLRRKQHAKLRSWVNNEPAIIKIQSLWRARQDRVKTQQTKSRLQNQAHAVRELQAAIRGALGRWRAGDLWHETREPEVEDRVAHLQAAIRGFQVRKRLANQKIAARNAAVNIVRLQAAARGLIQRKEHETTHGHFQQHHDTVTDVQSAARGLLVRLRQARTIGALQGRESGITKLQAIAKGSQVRRDHIQTKQKLRQEHANVKLLQSCARAMLQRQTIGKQFAALEKQESKIISLQALGRAYIERQRIFEQLIEMEKEDESITRLQAFARAMLTRINVGETLSALEDHESAIVDVQTACRAFIVRSNFAQKKKHYNDNMQKVIKLQSFVRAKQQGESYKSLVNGKNPPLPVVRRHLHLLTDTTLEFESELEAERLRRQVVESVRRNELVEGYVDGLDVKIALLVKNKITLDEVVKHQKHFGGSASQLLRNGAVIPGAGGLDLKALNKNSRKKLSGYEELFFMLQTQPGYLARLFHQLTAKGLAEKDAKNLERLTMMLFGYAQKSREEYFLLKVLSTGMQMTVSQSQNIDDYLRQQNAAFHQKVMSSYIRSPRDRSYLKGLFGSMVRDGICGQDHLDLESDPLQIYRAILNNEELSTGRPSARQRDLPREVVIREPDVRPKYVEHLQDLRDLCDSFFLSLEETLHRMPYGVRFLAAENYRALCEHFPREDPAQLALQSGAWIWKTFLLPAVKEPEMWGIIDRGLSPAHKRNLGQVVTVLSQVAAGRLFSSENLYLQPLNNWISESLDRWQECLTQVFDAPNPDEYFDADQFSDLYSRTKPSLYIKLADIFALHSLVSENVSAVASGRDDPIKELLADLGTAKSNESDLSGAVSGGEITLTLKSKFTVQDDPNSEARALFTATKRLVLYVIKVQSGSNLMEILLRPISHEDADRWIQLVREEVAEQDSKRPKRRNSTFDPRGSLRGARTQSVYSEAPSAFSDDRRDLLDLQSMSYAELKSSALENILALEQPTVPPQFRVSRHNNYQEILNALAADIRQKHRRRLERQREIESTRATLAQLDDKANFLEDQLKSYNDYIEQCLHTLANKKSGKPRFLMPFTKQWNHERELEKAGRQPKFGSYKYSARQLADKGVLLQWPGYPPEHWGQLNVVISSDDVGVFHLEGSSGSMMLPGASANLLLDDLLQAQYDNKNSITVFEEAGGGAKLAVNLLLHLVFKKFYKDG